MTGSERLKKRFKGGVPHKAKKEEKSVIPGLKFFAQREFRKRKSGRNETDSRTRKKGYTSF